MLALQGDFAEHEQALLDMRELRTSGQLRRAADFEGLRRAWCCQVARARPCSSCSQLEGLSEPSLQTVFHAFGACRCYGDLRWRSSCWRREVEQTGRAASVWGSIDVAVERNGYGRQLDSHESLEPCPALGDGSLPMVFIRAPVISRVGPEVEVLAEHRGQPVLVREGRVLVSTFHPELTDDVRVHRYFLEHVVPSG